MMTEPTAEHRWLQQFVGEWTAESRMVNAPGADGTPAEDTVSKATETVRAIGPFWVQFESKGNFPGCGDATLQLTLGYDVRNKRFVGTWLGSMMSELWIYDITRDASGNVLTMAVEGPSMSGEGTSNYRDVIEWKSPDHRRMTSWSEGENGEWRCFMECDYRRVR